MADTHMEVLEVEGDLAPPRRNGELVFEAPWESRVFGVTMALFENGQFEWEEFRELLIDEIGTWERESSPDGTAGWSYYRCWQRAFERLAAGRGWLSRDEMDGRTVSLAERPHGHDHGTG